MMNAKDVLNFWFKEISPKSWWTKDITLDRSIQERFSDLHEKAAKCELWEWRRSAEGRLAEIIVLDQFSRNMFRDDARSFSQDPLALTLSQEAVQGGFDKTLSTEQKIFLYLPHMHSESLAIHAEAQRLFSQPGLESNLDFERKHLDILRRFGRYPHRNKILGRRSTPEELEFLKQPGSSF